MKYTATADKETFRLTASDGIISGMSNHIISDVIATKLIFSTQPAPTSIEKDVETTFTTVPVVKAVDADDAVDTDFAESVTIVENGTGIGTFTNATATASSGVASFTGLTLNHNADETFKLAATGGSLTEGSSGDVTVASNQAPIPIPTPPPASGGGGSTYTPPPAPTTPTPEPEEEEEEETVEPIVEVEEEKVVVQPISEPIVVARPTGNAEGTGTKPELDNVTRLYIATFGRAPESAGSIYWLYESKLNLEDIARSFFDQEETKGKYPEGFSNYDFIVAIYNHVYGRNPDQAGGDYWLKELDSGKIEKALFILAIINGAIGDDALMLGKQTTAGVIFVRSGVESLDLAKKVIDDIKR